MNIGHVPLTPPWIAHNDGSKSISVNDQHTFNQSVSDAFQKMNSNLIDLAAAINNIRREMEDQNILYRHFQQFVQDHHLDVFKEYTTTLLVQAKLEQANGN